MALAQLGPYDGENRQQERRREWLLIAVEAKARLGRLDEHHDAGNQHELDNESARRREGADRTTLDGESPGKYEDVAENSVEDELLHGGRPFEKRQQRARVLQDPPLLDHVDLDMR